MLQALLVLGMASMTFHVRRNQVSLQAAVMGRLLEAESRSMFELM